MKIIGYWGDKSPAETTTINCCGHIFTFHGREINRPEGRDDYLLLYIYRGEATFFFDEKKVVCKSGDFVLYAPHQPQHHIYDSNKSGEFYYIHFSTEDKAFAETLGMSTLTPYHTTPSPELTDEFERIISELQTRGYGYKDVVLNLCNQLFIKIRRHILNNETEVYPTDIKTVIQYINKHYDEDTSLDEYAGMCRISKVHLIRKFNRLCSMSPIKYRNNVRLSHAKEMLKSSQMTVKDISQKLGYSSSEYFSQAFKNAVGLSPHEYRNSQLNLNITIKENKDKF